MPEHAPLLPAHKIRFVQSRILQTIAGGIRFNAPAWVILFQLFLFLFPIGSFLLLEFIRCRSHPSALFLPANGTLWDLSESVSWHLLYGGCLCLGYILSRVLNRIGENETKASRIRPAPKADAVSMLKEESDVDFGATRQVMRFVFEQRSCWRVAIEAIIAIVLGFLLSLGLYVQELNTVVKAFDLLALASAAYALCIRQPVELWQRGEVNGAANRAVHVIGLCLGHVVLVVLGPGLASNGLLMVLAVSPLLWSFGTYPSVLTLAEWALEQAAMLVFGCTIAPTLQRLLENVALSVLAWMLLWFPLAMEQVLIALVCSFLWIYVLASGYSPVIGLNKSCMFILGERTGAILQALKVGSIVAVVCLAYIFAEEPMWPRACVAFNALLSIITLMQKELRKPFLFGVMRNRRGEKLKAENNSEWIIVARWLNSFLQMGWLARTATIGLTHDRWSAESMMSSAVLVGGARRAMVSPDVQSLSLVLSELSFGLIDQSNAVLLFFLCYVGTDRVTRLLSKVHLIYLLLASSSSLFQYKVTKAAVLMIDMCIAIACAVLDSPMLPVLGTPITFIGFPRPKRLWYAPREVRGCTEGAYYNQVLEQIESVIAESLLDVRSGMIYMIRIGKMVAYVLITEVGLDYAVVEVKGLELQDRTSCHHVEAGFLDRVVDQLQECRSEEASIANEDGHPPGCLHPVAPVKLGIVPLFRREFVCYEESKVRLTGVIENEDFHRILNRAFLFTLTFSLRTIPEASRQMMTKEWDLTTSDDDDFPMDWFLYLCKKTSGPCGPIGPTGDDFNDNNALESEMDELLGDMDSLWHLERGEAPTVSANSLKNTVSVGITRSPLKVTTRSIDSLSSSAEIMKAIVLFIERTVNCSGFPMSDVATWGGRHVCDCFSGSFPPSSDLRRLQNNPLVYELTVHSYRTALKLALDAHTCLDPDPGFGDFDQVEGCLKEYKECWYIGLPESEDWAARVKDGCANLLALRKAQGKQEELLQLTFGKQEGWVFQVREEVVQALWSNLALEIFYFTCDDDERLSIQASPLLLRNLHIQAADVPLGYPVFQTGFITVQRK